MSKSSSGFWLHLDQPQRLSLQGVGVCHLEKLCLFGIAGHHTAVPTACSQVSQQCSKALHWQITGRFVFFLLEARRLRRKHTKRPVICQCRAFEHCWLTWEHAVGTAVWWPAIPNKQSL